MGVHYERRGCAVVITIDRPERRNAVDGDTAAALLEHFHAFCDDDAARVLVLTGAGEQAFCAGADLKAIDTLDPDARGGPLGFTRLQSPKPTIAAVSGWCLVGGLELALSTAVRCSRAQACRSPTGSRSRPGWAARCSRPASRGPYGSPPAPGGAAGRREGLKGSGLMSFAGGPIPGLCGYWSSTTPS